MEPSFGPFSGGGGTLGSEASSSASDLLSPAAPSMSPQPASGRSSSSQVASWSRSVNRLRRRTVPGRGSDVAIAVRMPEPRPSGQLFDQPS